jgi:hypothetical protein
MKATPTGSFFTKRRNPSSAWPGTAASLSSARERRYSARMRMVSISLAQ